MTDHILAHPGFGWGWGGGPWWGFAPWWGIGTLALVAVVAAALIVYYARRPRWRSFGGSGAAASLSTAEELLARRFAAGEISEEEYLSRLSVLRRPPQ
ncbi:MAG TPA: SHOCT domain-containing protein [Pseudonocardiaceae bacterium]|nr:SHOCT domain-containing protein [Pseudonocardiaceae bacterium]